MRWDLNVLSFLTMDKINKMSGKELKQLDNFLTNTVNKRLSYTSKVGEGPAQARLASFYGKAGITKAPKATGSKNAIIGQILAKKHFIESKTSKVSKLNNFLEVKRRLTTDIKGLTPGQIIDALQEMGGSVYENVYRTYVDTNGLIDAIEEKIFDDDDSTSLEEIVDSLINAYQEKIREHETVPEYFKRSW